MTAGGFPTSYVPIEVRDGRSRADWTREEEVRLSAGREGLSDSTQALCFLAGANSIFTGEKLLTAPNAGGDADAALFEELGLKALQSQEPLRIHATETAR